MNENEISYAIRGAIFKVFQTLGPGLLESAYQKILSFELTKAGLNVKQQVALPIVYESEHLEAGYRIDLLVDEKVIIEIKSVENLSEVHHKQLITYLKLSGKKLGLLVNFNSAKIEESIYRKVNNL